MNYLIILPNSMPINTSIKKIKNIDQSIYNHIGCCPKNDYILTVLIPKIMTSGMNP